MPERRVGGSGAVIPGSNVSSESAGPADASDVIVIFGHTWWERAVERGRHRAEDRLMTHLLASPRVGRLVVADNYRDWPVYLAKRLLGERVAPLPARPQGRPASRFRPRRLLRRTARSEATASRMARRYSRRLGAHAKRQGLTQPHVVCLNPLLAGFGPFPWAATVTFFATDDWASHPQFTAEHEVIRRSYAGVREQGRLVAGVTPELVTRISGGPGLAVANGVNPADWAAPGPPPAWAKALMRPLAVYVGAVAAQRIDVEAVRQVAEALEGSVLIVGPVSDHDIAAALKQIPGVTLHPGIPYADVPGLLASADLALLPHHHTPLTESMSPLKVYEALAAGVPVVAADLAPVRDLGPDVVLVPEGGDYGAATREALERRDHAKEARLAFAAAHAWTARFDTLLDEILSAPVSSPARR